MEDYIHFDVPDGKEPADRQFLEQLGHRVMVCAGPEQGTLCPILSCQSPEAYLDATSPKPPREVPADR